MGKEEKFIRDVLRNAQCGADVSNDQWTEISRKLLDGCGVNLTRILLKKYPSTPSDVLVVSIHEAIYALVRKVRLGQLDESKGHFRFLIACALNKLKDHFKKASVRPRLSGGHSDQDLENAYFEILDQVPSVSVTGNLELAELIAKLETVVTTLENEFAQSSSGRIPFYHQVLKIQLKLFPDYYSHSELAEVLTEEGVKCNGEQIRTARKTLLKKYGWMIR